MINQDFTEHFKDYSPTVYAHAKLDEIAQSVDIETNWLADRGQAYIALVHGFIYDTELDIGYFVQTGIILENGITSLVFEFRDNSPQYRIMLTHSIKKDDPNLPQHKYALKITTLDPATDPEEIEDVVRDISSYADSFHCDIFNALKD
ncbi:MAG: hypothetical protein ABIJ34_03995 [archaeon]